MDNLPRSIVAPRNPSNPDPYEIFTEHCDQVLDISSQPGHMTTTRVYYANDSMSMESGLNYRSSTRQIRRSPESSKYTMMHGFELAYLNTAKDHSALKQIDSTIKSTISQYTGVHPGSMFSTEELEKMQHLPPEVARQLIDERRRTDLEFRSQAAKHPKQPLGTGTGAGAELSKNINETSKKLVPYTLSPHTISPAGPSQTTRLFRHPSAIVLQGGVEPGPTGTVEVKAQARLSNRFSASVYAIGDGSIDTSGSKDGFESSHRHRSGSKHYDEYSSKSLNSVAQTASEYAQDLNKTIRRAIVAPGKVVNTSLTAEGDLWNFTMKYSNDESVVGASGVYRVPFMDKPSNAMDFTLAARLNPAKSHLQASLKSDASKNGKSSDYGFDEIKEKFSSSARNLSKNLLSSGQGDSSTAVSSGSPQRPSINQIVAKYRLPYVEAVDFGGEYLYSLESGGDQFSFGGRLVVSPERVGLISSRAVDGVKSVFSSSASNSSSAAMKSTLSNDKKELSRAAAAAKAAALAEREDTDVATVVRKLYERATSHNTTASHSYNSACLCLHCTRSDALLYRRTPIVLTATVNGVGTAQLTSSIPFSLQGNSVKSLLQNRFVLSTRLQHNLASRESKLELGVSTIFTTSDIFQSFRKVAEYSEDGRNATSMYDAISMASEIRNELEHEYKSHLTSTDAYNDQRIQEQARNNTLSVLGRGNIGVSASKITEEVAPSLNRSIGWFSAVKSYLSRFTEPTLWSPRPAVEQVCMIESPTCGWHQVRAAMDTRRGYNVDWKYYGEWFSLGLNLGSRAIPDGRLNHVFPPLPAGHSNLNNNAYGKMQATPAILSSKKSHRIFPPNTPLWNSLPFDTIGFSINFGE